MHLRQRTFAGIVLLLSMGSISNAARDWEANPYPPWMRVRRAIAAADSDLDVRIDCIGSPNTTAVLEVEINGAPVDRIEFDKPVERRGQLNLFDATLDLTAYSLRPGDSLLLRATATGPAGSLSTTARVRVRPSGDVVVVEPPGGGTTIPVGGF